MTTSKTLAIDVTYRLVRLGWPNSAAIAALALVPMVAFGTLSDAPSPPAETAAFRLASAGQAAGDAAAGWSEVRTRQAE